MKILQKAINGKNKQGQVILISENDEDMWHLYNIIRPGDSFKSAGIRKVKNESNTGSVTTKKVNVNLVIKVEKVNFEVEACQLRIAGKVIDENQYVSMGSYHSLTVDKDKKFTLAKEYWDSVTLETLSEACDAAKKADIAAVVMQDGLAHICLVLNSMTIVKLKIDMAVPKKRKGFTNNHDKGLQKFYLAVLRGIIQHVDFGIVKCLILASPGFLKDEFYKFAISQAEASRNSEFKAFKDNKDKILKLHSSDGYKHSLREILSQPGVQNQLQDTRTANELQALDDFYEKLSIAPEWAVYGPKEVFSAQKEGAIKTLLISDVLFRSTDLDERRKYVKLVESTKNAGGKVYKFSSLHVTGERLNNLTGVAAILRFPMDMSLISSDSDSSINDL